ncbi:hypothetical protein V8J85_06220 [Yoonia sp. 2307UL14-13]
MFTPDEDGIYARVGASPGRRAFGYGVLLALGVILIYLPLAQPPAIGWAVMMLAMGLASLWLAERLRWATRGVILLTENDLRDGDGRILAEIADVREVDRGAFAFKPSNGFTLVLHSKKPRAWAPGLWWRLGRRVGVGGVTSAGQAKFMAEQIAFRVSARN